MAHYRYIGMRPRLLRVDLQAQLIPWSCAQIFKSVLLLV